MLFNLTPDRSVTGGAWYSDQDFESEFVEVLNQQCFKYLQQKVENAEKDVSLVMFGSLNLCVSLVQSSLLPINCCWPLRNGRKSSCSDN